MFLDDDMRNSWLFRHVLFPESEYSARIFSSQKWDNSSWIYGIQFLLRKLKISKININTISTLFKIIILRHYAKFLLIIKFFIKLFLSHGISFWGWHNRIWRWHTLVIKHQKTLPSLKGAQVTFLRSHLRKIFMQIFNRFISDLFILFTRRWINSRIPVPLHQSLECIFVSTSSMQKTFRQRTTKSSFNEISD